MESNRKNGQRSAGTAAGVLILILGLGAALLSTSARNMPGAGSAELPRKEISHQAAEGETSNRHTASASVEETPARDPRDAELAKRLELNAADETPAMKIFAEYSRDELRLMANYQKATGQAPPSGLRKIILLRRSGGSQERLLQGIDQLGLSLMGRAAVREWVLESKNDPEMETRAKRLAATKDSNDLRPAAILPASSGR